MDSVAVPLDPSRVRLVLTITEVPGLPGKTYEFELPRELAEHFQQGPRGAYTKYPFHLSLVLRRPDDDQAEQLVYGMLRECIENGAFMRAAAEATAAKDDGDIDLVMNKMIADCGGDVRSALRDSVLAGARLAFIIDTLGVTFGVMEIGSKPADMPRREEPRGTGRLGDDSGPEGPTIR